MNFIYENFFNQLRNFKNNLKDDPEQIVKNLVATGRMSTEQYNDLYQKSKYLMQLLK